MTTQTPSVGTDPAGAPSPSFEELRSRFAPDTVYLNTATFGLPSDRVVAAMRTGIERWQRGVATPAEYDGAVDRSRELFAQLVGVAPETVWDSLESLVLRARVRA